MDPNSTLSQYQPEHFREESFNPTPTFLSCQWQADMSLEYATLYDSSPLSPTLSGGKNYQSRFQTPTTLGSLTPPPGSPLTSESTVDSLYDTLAISTAFHPGGIPAPDTVFSSTDGVAFYVEAQTILNDCPNAFEPYLCAPLSDPQYRMELIHLDVPSTELNIILHTLYGTSPAAHSPDIGTLVCAVDRMPDFSLLPQSLIGPSTPMHDLLLSHAPMHPLDVYALAAHHGLSSLAVSVSSFLLSCDLATITDEIAERIGAVFLKNLLQLHADRITSLREILLHPPHPHPQTKQCNFEEQRKVTRAWVLMTAYLAWEAKADLSAHSLQTTLGPLLEHLTCQSCHKALEDRIKEVVVQWTSVKVNF